VRDALHVVGWCDKAFRYLTAHAAGVPAPGIAAPFQQDCVFRGKRLRMHEDATTLEYRDAMGRTIYRWRKGRPWPDVAGLEFWLQ
jgi:hypothetical protein